MVRIRGVAEDSNSKHVMPGLVPGIHDFMRGIKQDEDGQNKPGHDVTLRYAQEARSYRNGSLSSSACACCTAGAKAACLPTFSA